MSERNERTVSIGQPGQIIQRLKIETPGALIHIETDHMDDQGRPVLTVSVSATQYPGEPAWVICDLPGTAGHTAQDRRRTGVGFRVIEADHKHYRDGLGTEVVWEGLFEQCPLCREWEAATGTCHTCHGTGERRLTGTRCGDCDGTGRTKPKTVHTRP